MAPQTPVGTRFVRLGYPRPKPPRLFTMVSIVGLLALVGLLYVYIHVVVVPPLSANAENKVVCAPRQGFLDVSAAIANAVPFIETVHIGRFGDDPELVPVVGDGPKFIAGSRVSVVLAELIDAGGVVGQRDMRALDGLRGGDLIAIREQLEQSDKGQRGRQAGSNPEREGRDLERVRGPLFLALFLGGLFWALRDAYYSGGVMRANQYVGLSLIAVSLMVLLWP